METSFIIFIMTQPIITSIQRTPGLCVPLNLGHEYQALKGSKSTLEKFNSWVFLEFNSWTLIAFFNENPRVFLGYLMDTYQEVGQVRQGQDVFWLKSKADVMAFLHDNLVRHSCVDDMLIRLRKEN